MKEFIKKYKKGFLITISLWVYISFLISATWGSVNCDKDYPIKYVIYSGLFCEIK